MAERTKLASDAGAAGWVTTERYVVPPEQVLVVDEWLGEVGALWDALETSCVAGCCGMDAFDFTPEAVRRAVASEERAAVAAQLQSIEQRVGASAAMHFQSARFGTRLYREEFIELLRGIREALTA